nr:BlaI/MecI/CopY family transcriptional regulator [uncultured Sphingomonas sp.]
MDRRISESEWAVMEVLWYSKAPQSATDVADALSDDREWTLATVKTLLSRLTAKGVVAFDKDGRRFLYRPVVARDSMLGKESRRFVDRLFGGQLSPLMARLAEEDALDDADIEAIEKLLKELKS